MKTQRICFFFFFFHITSDSNPENQNQALVLLDLLLLLLLLLEEYQQTLFPILFYRERLIYPSRKARGMISTHS
jgi:hypothetical protein